MLGITIEVNLTHYTKFALAKKALHIKCVRIFILPLDIFPQNSPKFGNYHVIPPSKQITCPDKYAALSDDKKLTKLPTSSVVPKRSSGIFSVNSLLSS